MKDGKVLKYYIQVEAACLEDFLDHDNASQWTRYLAVVHSLMHEADRSPRIVELEKDYLGSGFDIFTFYAKADRTKFLKAFKKIGVTDDLLLLSKEIVG